MTGVGTTVYWRGTRLALYRGRVVADLGGECAVSCNESGRVLWLKLGQFFTDPFDLRNEETQ